MPRVSSELLSKSSSPEEARNRRAAKKAIVPIEAVRVRAFTIPTALGNKIIHPYSDFLVHDIGSSDGIPVLPGPDFAPTAKLMRTAPLWALRTRNRLMHDGLSSTKQEAIARHTGQAESVTQKYDALAPADQAKLLAFLDSL